jgi:hypothetical protein
LGQLSEVAVIRTADARRHSAINQKKALEKALGDDLPRAGPYSLEPANGRAQRPVIAIILSFITEGTAPISRASQVFSRRPPFPRLPSCHKFQLSLLGAFP